MKINMIGRGFLVLFAGEESSLREGFFSQRSNLTTIASSERFKIASCLVMTTFLLESVVDSVVEGQPKRYSVQRVKMPK